MSVDDDLFFVQKKKNRFVEPNKPSRSFIIQENKNNDTEFTLSSTVISYHYAYDTYFSFQRSWYNRV